MSTERISLEQRATRHAALADVARLAVMDELALGDRSPSELEAIIGIPSNLLAHHLKVLEGAGMVARRRSEGDRRRTYLTSTNVWLPDSALVAEVPVGRVVFVCSANSARSQLAAALWSRASDIPVTSAGTDPADQIAEGARAVAERRSLRLVSEAPQSFTAITDPGDFVVAVCDNAYEGLGSAVSLHWSIPDPVVQGNDAGFDHAYAELDRRISVLAPQLLAA